jgi:hypothetical protein
LRVLGSCVIIIAIVHGRYGRAEKQHGTEEICIVRNIILIR